MMPGFYNHNYLILQTPDAVVLQVEMIHDARIIPLTGRPHLQSGIRQWLGDSRGYWEGETLIVETTNFTDKAGERRGKEEYPESEPQRLWHGASSSSILVAGKAFLLPSLPGTESKE